MDEQNKQALVQNQSQNVPDYTNEINAMYDAQRQQQVQSLEDAYNQNVQTLQAAKQSIAPTYNTQANDLATQYERTRRNNNLQADYNGLNTGTGSQMALAQQSNYLSAFGNIRAKQAEAEQNVENQLAQLEVGYKNAVAQAIADNDYQRASALLNEYKRRDEAAKEEQRYQYQLSLSEQKYQDQLRRQAEQDAFAREQYNNQLTRQQEQDALAKEQYGNQLARQQEQDAFSRQQYDDTMALNKAKTLASYGDFSGYAELYGPEVANAMQQYWNIYNGGSGTGTSSGSSRSGGYSYTGSDSGSGNGPGKLNLPELPEDGSGGSGNSYNFEWQLAKHMDNNGTSASDKNVADSAYQMKRELEMTANGQAQMEAIQQGLTPGKAGYNNYVSQRTQELLNSNPDYIAATNLHNDSASKVEAQRQAEEQAAKKEQRLGDWDHVIDDDAIAWAEINDREAEYRRLTERYRAQAEAALAAQKAQADGKKRTS